MDGNEQAAIEHKPRLRRTLIILCIGLVAFVVIVGFAANLVVNRQHKIDATNREADHLPVPAGTDSGGVTMASLMHSDTAIYAYPLIQADIRGTKTQTYDALVKDGWVNTNKQLSELCLSNTKS